MDQYRVALVGEPGAGKTAIAHALGHTISFAGALRVECAGILADATGEPVMTWVDQMLLSTGKDYYRPFLQWYGQWRRDRDEDYWVRQLEKRINHLQGADVLACDDVRYPNEYDMLRRHGFFFVRLLDGPYVRVLDKEQLAHPSERFWRHWDVDARLEYEEGVEKQAEKIKKLIDEVHS